MIYLKEFADRRTTYKKAINEHEGMRIVCQLRHRVSGFDPVNLDNVIAAAVVNEEGVSMDSNSDLYDIPLPLTTVYTDSNKRETFACSVLAPEGAFVLDRDYLHKRRQTGRYTKTKRGRFSIDPARGRFMERRYLARSVVADELVAYAHGNREEVARLLTRISHVGKYRGTGQGHVKKWVIEPHQVEPLDTLVRAERLTRNISQEACEALGCNPEGEPVRVPVSIPYWHPASVGLGYRVGTNAIRVGV